MKCKIMTREEFIGMCEMDAQNWYLSGYSSDELTAEDILNEYPEDYFSDSTDDLSSCFTPEEFAAKTLEYLAELAEIENEEIFCDEDDDDKEV